MNIDETSVKIIKSMFWCNGWLKPNERAISRVDAIHLSDHGWNLVPVQMKHDVLVSEVVEYSQSVDLRYCASLLSQSLPSRRVQDRSFLASAVQGKTIPEHRFSGEGRCSICGLHAENMVDRNMLVFEKIMWGGVRLSDISYVWLDLQLLEKTMDLSYNYEELRNILDSFATVNVEMSASKFAASLKAVKGNKAEREVLCGILGICDIFQHPDHHGFLNHYPLEIDRELPNQHYIDLAWPFCWYNSRFGVNEFAFELITSTGVHN